MAEPIPPYILRLTFGSQYSREPHPHVNWAHPNGWFEVQVTNAPSEEQAHEIARDRAIQFVGGAYAFDYTPAVWEETDRITRDTWYPLGVLARISMEWPECRPHLEVYRRFRPSMVEAN